MLKTIEAIIDENGNVRLLEPVSLGRSTKALVTILDTADEFDTGHLSETALLSEQALAKDWDRPEEDEAWKDLQQAK